METEKVMFGGREQLVEDHPNFAAAMNALKRDREWHEHPSDVCECGPYRWPCPTCGQPVIEDGEGMVDNVVYGSNGQCQTCFFGIGPND